MNSIVKGLTGLLVMVVLSVSVRVRAQDSLRLTLPEIEHRFISKNLSLLARHYAIDMANAEVIQARLFPNPVLLATGNAYDPTNKKGLNWSNATGQYVFDVQQLIQLAGKRNKRIHLAQTNVLLEENAFFDLLRTLRFSLRSNFYELYFLQRSIHAYRLQIAYLEKLNLTHEDLQKKGIVTMKDAVRIKSLLYTLKSEQAIFQNQANDLNAELQLFIQDNASLIIPLADTSATTPNLQRYTVAALLDSAYTHRSDLKEAQNNLLYSQQNYALQKAMAVPDLTLGAQFDKRGSNVDNATFLSIAMDLPFFNRNQGNVKAAKLRIDQSAVLLQQKNTIVENEVLRAYAKVMNTDRTISSFDISFVDELQQLLQNITENFQKRNISLLEFTDFYQSYKENLLQFNQLRNERMQAMEALQFAVGKPIF